jgi:fructosamine-3-kinase
MLTPALEAALGGALGAEVVAATPLGGGDINDAYRVQLDDGRAIFVKTNRGTDRRMFPCEAKGLAWLAEPGAIRVPEVLAVSDEEGEGPQFLALELLEARGRAEDYDELLGRALAKLHRFGAPTFGLDHDNFIATLRQANAPIASWPEFYALRRLEPQVRLAVDDKRAPSGWSRRFERLFGRIEELAGPAEPPARLHGDLWSGNLHADERGAPVLIDPAVYGGHREIDLAMLELFGSPGPRFWDTYGDVYPLADERRDRVRLYQLYPLLVHVNLFGGSYVSSVEDVLSRYA